MKKLFTILSIALMSAFATATASTKNGYETATQTESAIKIDIPVNMIVKQTIVFIDDTSVVVYYQKEGNVCRLYSNTDVTKYKQEDLNRIKSTTFEVTDHVKGKCLMTKNTSDIISMAKSIFGK